MGKLTSESVIITGSTGFIGSNLVRRSLKEGADVHIITRNKSNKWRLNEVLCDIKEYHADLTDYSGISSIIREVEPSIIFHLATYGGDPSQKDTLKIMKSNLEGTINLVNASKKVGFDILVNTSSSSEYGIKSNPMHETDLLEPINDYGVSKAATTLYCQSVARNENLPMVTLRLFSPYGYYEGKNRLIPSVISDCMIGKNPKVSSPNFVRDFIFIEDVLDSYISLTERCDSLTPGDIFNIGSGKQHNIGEVVEHIINLTKKKVRPEWGLTPKWAHELPKWEADISKANKYLGWSPNHSLESGLTKTVKWFAENSFLYD